MVREIRGPLSQQTAPSLGLTSGCLFKLMPQPGFSAFRKVHIPPSPTKRSFIISVKPEFQRHVQL